MLGSYLSFATWTAIVVMKRQVGEQEKYFLVWDVKLKCLDAMHFIVRIRNEINTEHTRKGIFLKQISRSIFLKSPEDREGLYIFNIVCF